MATKYKAAVFDMDGTILDTIEDLKDSLNHSLTRFGYSGDFTFEATGFDQKGIVNIRNLNDQFALARTYLNGEE